MNNFTQVVSEIKLITNYAGKFEFKFYLKQIKLIILIIYERFYSPSHALVKIESNTKFKILPLFLSKKPK